MNVEEYLGGSYKRRFIRKDSGFMRFLFELILDKKIKKIIVVNVNWKLDDEIVKTIPPECEMVIAYDIKGLQKEIEKNKEDLGLIILPDKMNPAGLSREELDKSEAFYAGAYFAKEKNCPVPVIVVEPASIYASYVLELAYIPKEILRW